MNKIVFAIFFSMLWAGAHAGTPGTMRVDYFHSGNN